MPTPFELREWDQDIAALNAAIVRIVVARVVSVVGVITAAKVVAMAEVEIFAQQSRRTRVLAVI